MGTAAVADALLTPGPMPLPDVFDSASRLYCLEGEGELAELLAEAWSSRESLSAPWELKLSALSLRADLDVAAMLGRKLTLMTRLADGSEHRRPGLITAASACDSDGGFARYRLTLQPWLSLLGHTRRSQVWQECTVTQIIESVFAAYHGQAAWSWADDIAQHLQASRNAGVRSYTVQYRETDLGFVQRLLAEEGIAYRFELDEGAPLGHQLVLFADSARDVSCPEDITSASAVGGRGIRFHRASSQEEQDAIQAFGGARRIESASTTVLGWDYKAKRSIAASAPSVGANGGENAPRLERYDHAGAYAFADTAEAERAAVLQQQALEARHKRWLGRSTVRSFAAGTTFELTQSTLDLLSALGEQRANEHGQDRRFLLTQVIHAGINNLPKDLSQRIAERSGGQGADLLEPWVDDAVRRQAAEAGYGNAFEASRAVVPWRPLLLDDTGARLNPKPLAPGPQTATVVGPNGETAARGADEIHTDALGRIRIRLHFQSRPQGPDTSITSTWVRVLQRYAGAGMGLQFIPRIGQEVLVDFADGDIDRPLVIGALYDGRGEGGVPPTPGGRSAGADTSVIADSSDHCPSAQGNLAGGHSPAWHGASPQDSTSKGGQRNAAALSGFKTKEFGGEGFNQLVFDDTNAQLRVQLATSAHATQLNLGHLIHQADNHRGSFRGTGFELRTDAYGAVRSGAGLLLSTFAAQPREPAGDNAAGIALHGQLDTLAQTLNDAARTHQTVRLAGQVGSIKAGKSHLSDAQAPLPALHTVLKGMVSSASADEALADAASRHTEAGPGKLPHTTDPIIAVTAKAGLAVVAGQDIQLAADETITLASGEDTHWAIGGALRIHTGQAIGLLGGAIKPGDQAVGNGVTMIAAQGDIDVQAQAGTLQVAAKNDLSVQSAKAHIDWAAAKRISLSTAGGANITIEGGAITVQCPGKIAVRAGKKSFVGPQTVNYPLPALPGSICVECLLSARATGAPFALR